MNGLESFLEKYKEHLEDIIIGGGWAVEILQDRVSNPYREHHDTDTVVLDENLDVEDCSQKAEGEYFYSITIESKGWLLKFINEKEINIKDRTYKVKVPCPEFIAVSKAFSSLGEAREKDNKDIEYLFKNFNLRKKILFDLIEKSHPLRKGSVFLDMAKQEFEIPAKTRDEFNQELLKQKYGLEELIYNIPTEDLEDFNSLFSKIKKNLGSKRTEIIGKKLSNLSDSQEALDYGNAIWMALEYATDGMKPGLVEKMLAIPDSQEALDYGNAIWRALEYATDGMKSGLVEKMLAILDSQEALKYGKSIWRALMCAEDGMKPGLVEKIPIPTNTIPV